MASKREKGLEDLCYKMQDLFREQESLAQCGYWLFGMLGALVGLVLGLFVGLVW